MIDRADDRVLDAAAGLAEGRLNPREEVEVQGRDRALDDVEDDDPEHGDGAERGQRGDELGQPVPDQTPPGATLGLQRRADARGFHLSASRSRSGAR